MTWYGREEALPIKNAEEFKNYLKQLDWSGWKPSGMALHNTASPTLDQWWHGGTSPEQRMKNLRNYYENDMGWSSGPHAFMDGETWWIFVDFNVKGVHSPSWNGTRLGIEMVGDYDHEDDESGMGAQVMQTTVALFGECCSFFGFEPNGEKIKLHKEDPATDHDCPGKNIVKQEFLDDVNEYMGSGGGDTDRPSKPRRGVVHSVEEGDHLNIRAESSSSSPVIGTADNGDKLTVLSEAYNGSTRWLRIDLSDRTGPEAYGWVSADYVKLDGEQPAQSAWRNSITATVFGGGDDSQDSAYPDIDWITSSTKGVALPYKWKGTRPLVVVKGPKGQVSVPIVDLGPWNTHDPLYVLEGKRPMSEYQYEHRVPAQNGQVPSNDAGIDLTEPVAKAVGVSGKGTVQWRFATTSESSAVARADVPSKRKRKA